MATPELLAKLNGDLTALPYEKLQTLYERSPGRFRARLEPAAVGLAGGDRSQGAYRSRSRCDRAGQRGGSGPENEAAADAPSATETAVLPILDKANRLLAELGERNKVAELLVGQTTRELLTHECCKAIAGEATRGCTTSSTAACLRSCSGPIDTVRAGGRTARQGAPPTVPRADRKPTCARCGDRCRSICAGPEETERTAASARPGRRQPCRKSRSWKTRSRETDTAEPASSRSDFRRKRPRTSRPQWTCTSWSCSGFRCTPARSRSSSATASA